MRASINKNRHVNPIKIHMRECKHLKSELQAGLIHLCFILSDFTFLTSYAILELC